MSSDFVSYPRIETRNFAQSRVQLSKRAEYSLRVLLSLAMARTVGRPLVPLTALAEVERIPVHFLEQILFSLRQGGHLHSTRGKNGGYSLTEASAAMRVGDLIRFLDGPLAPIACASQTAYQRCTCQDEATCGVRRLMIQARDALSQVFDSLTLQTFAERTLAEYQAVNLRPPLLAFLETAAKTKGHNKEAEPEYLI